MSSSSQTGLPPLDLSRWRNLPNRLMGAGGVVAVVGAALNLREFAFSWLTAYMFCLSLVLGGLFLVLVHHLFDAGWSVPIRRVCEHLANLAFPWMLLLFIPIALLAKPQLYEWMRNDPHADHAVHAKLPLFTLTGFYLVAALCFLSWWWLSSNLRRLSLEQDRSGAASCTFSMRKHAYYGIFLFAITLTLAAIMWMKALQHQWFSTMYGVYYFAGSVWTTLATVYVITMVLGRLGKLQKVLHEHQFYFLGSLLFAFTVFYAYIHFSQYFIIWNANMPEETFWYKVRENGSWFAVSLVIIFGHFFLPFLTLLRIDVKMNFAVMVPMAGWAWLMHFNDMCFNVLPVPHPQGLPWLWLWLPIGCAAFMIGLLSKMFLKDLMAHPMYPLKDPRLSEAMGLFHPVASPISGGEIDETDNYADSTINEDAAPESQGGAR